MSFPYSDDLTPDSPFVDASTHLAPNGIVCLAGVSSGGRNLSIDAGSINREMVLANEVVFGSVNANRRHYDAGAKSLAEADPTWLDRLHHPPHPTRPLARRSHATSRRRQAGDCLGERVKSDFLSLPTSKGRVKVRVRKGWETNIACLGAYDSQH